MDEMLKGREEWLEGQKTLRQWAEESRRAVFFGGAGVSTESGIPDFRSVDGLYHTRYADPPETILSHDFFWQRTADFFEFYRQKMLWPAALPNPAHRTLAQWEESGRLQAVITQNIDGLHQAAGSRRVLELHGSVHRNTCQSCGRTFGLEAILHSEGIPRCGCGGVIKPDVVLYGEQLDSDVLGQAVEAIRQADMLVVGGTSLAVYPAAGLIRYYRGRRLVLINASPTPYDQDADLLIPGPIGEILGGIDL